MPGVPVEFVTDEQVARFGCFDEAPPQAELERLRRGPTRVSGRSSTEAPHRASASSGLGPLRVLLPAGEGDET
ncbi:hypothetical protein GCM10023222_44150 [Saccharopolyspora cebuensis]